jgi:hypothetical protein
MAEHVTDVCKRVLEETCHNPLAPLGDVSLTAQMRTRIERWYSDRAFLADQVGRILAKSKENTPQATDYETEKRLAGLLEELKAVEDLEYHNGNWLALDEAKRSAEKRALLAEAILLTGQRTDVSRFV